MLLEWDVVQAENAILFIWRSLTPQKVCGPSPPHSQMVWATIWFGFRIAFVSRIYENGFSGRPAYLSALSVDFNGNSVLLWNKASLPKAVFKPEPLYSVWKITNRESDRRGANLFLKFSFWNFLCNFVVRNFIPW